MSCERTFSQDSVQIRGELNALNKSNSMLSLIQSNLIGKVSGSDLSGFFFQSLSALNKFVSSSNTAARKGKQMCKNEIKLDLLTSMWGLKKKESTTGERHLMTYFSVPGTSFSDTFRSINPVKMDTQVSKGPSQSMSLKKTL